MPSLIRFIVLLAVLGGIVFGAMFALTIFVEPKPREIQVRLPSNAIDLN
ncbi:MAG: histidine kinase [Nitratireductor sp.]|nr:histidine kinase [Nitratireductor sp.]